MFIRRAVAFVLVLVALDAAAESAAAQAAGPAPREPPPNSCIVKINAPARATVTVDGKDYGRKRELRYDRLRPGVEYRSHLQMRFPSGAIVERTLFLTGGRVLQIAASDPQEAHPELVVQTGLFWPMCREVSRDWRFLAVGENNRSASIWDLQTGRKLRTYQSQYHGVYHVAISPDNTLLAGIDGGTRSSKDGKTDETFATTLVWDLRNGRQVHVIEHGDVTADWLLFSPTEPLLAVGCSQSPAYGKDKGSKAPAKIEFWNTRTWQLVRKLELPWQKRIAFSPSGPLFAAASSQSRAYGKDKRSNEPAKLELWNTQTWRREFIAELADEPRALAFSADGERLAVGAGDDASGLTTCFGIPSGRVLFKLDHREGGIEALRFNPNGLQLVTACSQKNKNRPEGQSQYAGQLQLWGADGVQIWRLPVSMQFMQIAYRRDGRRLAASGYEERTQKPGGDLDYDIHVIDTDTPAIVARISSVPAYYLSYSPDGRRLLADERLFDPQTGNELKRLEGNSPPVRYLGFGPDRRRAVVGNVMWDLEAGKAVRRFEGHKVRLSPDGRIVATVLQEGTTYPICLWDADSGQQISCLAGHAKAVTDLEFSPDGERVISLSSDDTAVVWEIESGRKLFTLRESSYLELFGLAAESFDGERIATAISTLQPYPRTLKGLVFWNARTGERLHTVDRFQSFHDFVFARRSRQAFIDQERKVVLFDTDSGQVLREYDLGPSEYVLELELNRSGDRLLAACHDGSAVLWNVQTGERLRVFEGHVSNWFYPAAVSADGRWVATGETDGVVRFWDVATGENFAQLVDVGDQQADWLATTPQGLFDGSPAGRQSVTYRVGGGLNVVPVERFFQDFYRPGLLAELSRGERLLPGAEIGAKLAPLVRILSPDAETEVDAARLKLEVEVSDRGGGIKGPWLLQNGARVLVPGERRRDGSVLRRTFEVTLTDGENQLLVQAATEDGSWESEPAAIAVSYREPVTRPQLYLLAVGLNRYAQSSLNLQFAAVDAEAVARVFEERGASFYGRLGVHVHQLLNEKATKAEIRRSLAEIAEQARPNDTLVVFMAGHGVLVGQRFFLIPYEFKTGGAKLDEEIRVQGLSGDELDDAIAAVPALKRVVIYDTCHAGATLGPSRLSRSGFAFDKAMEQMSRSQGSFVLAATAAGAEAVELPELGHGVLTYALLAALGETQSGPLQGRLMKPAEQQPWINVREWFSFAQDKVPALSKVYFGQEQFVRFSSAGSDFPILSTRE